LVTNPIAVLVWVVVFLAFILYILVGNTIKFALRFSIRLHKNLRENGLTICSVSSALGAVVGQFNNHVLVGGLIGCGVYCLVHLYAWSVSGLAWRLPRWVIAKRGWLG
jgi:hypothetical protein